MTTDYRALCVELLDVIGSLVGGVECGHYRQRDMWKCREIFNRARAALAQPATEPPAPVDLSHLSDGEFNALVPQGYHGVGDCLPVPEGPTDEELLITYQRAVSNQVEIIIQSTGTYAGMDDLAAATLAGLYAVLARWGRAALAQPEPEGLTDEDMDDLADDLLGIVLPEGSGARLIKRALELWGRPVIKPVPVAERLPGPEDCDAEGQSWWYHPETMSCVACWCYSRGNGTEKHWLPHYALPVPQQEDNR